MVIQMNETQSYSSISSGYELRDNDWSVSDKAKKKKHWGKKLEGINQNLSHVKSNYTYIFQMLLQQLGSSNLCTSSLNSFSQSKKHREHSPLEVKQRRWTTSNPNNNLKTYELQNNSQTYATNEKSHLLPIHQIKIQEKR